MDGEKREVLVEFKDVCKSFKGGEVKVLDHFNFTFLKGETHVICGRSGAGKSTLIRCINYLEQIDSGEILVEGEAVTKKNVQDIRKRCAMVFQDFNLFPHMSVLENVTFGPIHSLHVSKQEAAKTGMEHLEQVGLADKANAKPWELSGGQKQRVAIAGIVAMRPKCIVLDEPTAMLDPVGRNEVIDTLHSLNEEKGITIILITHHMNEAIKADRVFVMDKGKLVMQGNPKEVFSHVEKLKSLGLEVPQVTELAYMLKKSGLNIEDGILTVEELMMQINENR